MQLHELTSAKGARTKKKRVGRGNGSGMGTYSGRGRKGQSARSGGKVRPGFEGGQTPLHKRLPKLKGFNNRFKQEFQVVNISKLSDLKEKTINAEVLKKVGLISKLTVPVKLLGDGEITVAMNVEVDLCSASAKDKIEKAGGKVTEKQTKKMADKNIEKKSKPATEKKVEKVVEKKVEKKPAKKVEKIIEKESKKDSKTSDKKPVKKTEKAEKKPAKKVAKKIEKKPEKKDTKK